MMHIARKVLGICCAKLGALHVVLTDKEEGDDAVNLTKWPYSARVHTRLHIIPYVSVLATPEKLAQPEKRRIDTDAFCGHARRA
eukprot:3199343-Amphidinium_carterae.1